MKPRCLVLVGGLAIALLFAPVRALAHCDALDGPVVKAAQQALAARDVALVLVWVGAPEEPEVRKAFDQTLLVRRLGPEAQTLADRFFFETVVRLHRAGEGEPFTGLKPAGLDPGPAVRLADRALADGRPDAVVKLITDEASRNLAALFAHASESRGYPPADLAAGRAHVKAYVTFVHFVERAYAAVSQAQLAHAHR